MTDKLIIPARIETSILSKVVEEIRQKCDDIEDDINSLQDQPGKLLFRSMRNLASIRDTSAVSIKDWSIQWHQAGAKVATIAKAVQMSWSGVSKWLGEADDSVETPVES